MVSTYHTHLRRLRGLQHNSASVTTKYVYNLRSIPTTHTAEAAAHANEVSILSQLDHPNIVKFYRTLTDPHGKLYICESIGARRYGVDCMHTRTLYDSVMEYGALGTLGDILSRSHRRLREDHIAFFIRSVLEVRCRV